MLLAEEDDPILPSPKSETDDEALEQVENDEEE